MICVMRLVGDLVLRPQLPLARLQSILDGHLAAIAEPPPVPQAFAASMRAVVGYDVLLRCMWPYLHLGRRLLVTVVWMSRRLVGATPCTYHHAAQGRHLTDSRFSKQHLAPQGCLLAQAVVAQVMAL